MKKGWKCLITWFFYLKSFYDYICLLLMCFLLPEVIYRYFHSKIFFNMYIKISRSVIKAYLFDFPHLWLLKQLVSQHTLRFANQKQRTLRCQINGDGGSLLIFRLFSDPRPLLSLLRPLPTRLWIFKEWWSAKFFSVAKWVFSFM